MRGALLAAETRDSSLADYRDRKIIATDVQPYMTQDFSPREDIHVHDSDCESDDGQLVEEAALNCYFHVVQAFAQKKGYYKKIKSRDFAITRREKPRGSLKGTAFSHVSNIARTKSIEQRRTVTALYMSNWRTRGEAAAADHFEKEYCVFPRWNWNYSCSGEGGVYPSNCPNESFNRHGIKSICADCAKNASLTHFLVHTARSLLKDDSHSRSDSATIEFPVTCSRLMVSITGFMREGIDIIEMGGVDGSGRATGWLGNIRHKIGIPLDQHRVRLINAALDGDSRPFLKMHKGASQDTIADAMVSGTVVKSQARGSTVHMYQSGLAVGNKRRCLPKMLESFESFLCTLQYQQLVNVVTYLRLSPFGDDISLYVRAKTEEELVNLLVAFYDNTLSYREMLSKGTTTYSHVRTIVDRIRVAGSGKENNTDNDTSGFEGLQRALL
ncbi:hypothetical protein SEMRO_1439_G272760.1 [Seminavis robusta]|uniref:Uncharacterized protein n=1 Tax=Seminavis robusta TaxID=568900 RepID=A0A9N8HRU1_9STRA|nr:hypothetical protein SEMRO_1439_G272760.1 [Seminavis robusta]|eukprot:Sro1439_g272760.1 n/a (442) ;mRNA; f:4493-5992